MHKLTYGIYDSVMKSMKQLKAEVRASVVNEVLAEEKDKLIKEQLPAVSEQVAAKLMQFVSQTRPALKEDSGKYSYLVEQLKYLILPFVEKDKVGMMVEQQSQYESQLNLLESKVDKSTKSLSEAINEIKISYKKNSILTSALSEAQARVRAYELLRTCEYKVDVEKDLLECETVEQVEKVYKQLMEKFKSKSRVSSFNGFSEATSTPGGIGRAGVPVLEKSDPKKIEQMRLAGLGK